MAFLYQYGIDEYEIPQCPPPNAESVNIVAWRWTFNPFTENCFSPLGKINPKRILSGKVDKCSCWGLSMYSNQSDAENVFKELEFTVKNARKNIGDHVSCGNILESDGVITEIESNGHFDFHPYVNIDVSSKFNPVRCIP